VIFLTIDPLIDVNFANQLAEAQRMAREWMAKHQQ